MKKTAILLLVILVHYVSAQDNVFSKKFVQNSMKEAFEWQEQNPKHKLYDWTNGAYYVGVSKAWKSTGKKYYYKGLLNLIDSTESKPGKRWYHADDITICQSYIDVYNYKKKADLTPTKENLDKLIAEGDDYSWKHKNHNMLWWWCDALFMAPPTFVKYGVSVNDMKYLEASDKWYKEAYDSLFNKEEHLWARDRSYIPDGGANDKLEANGKRIFWSRGNGWVFGGLALLLEDMPKDYPSRSFYETLFKEMAGRLKEIQPEDGAWKASLLYPEGHEHGEASGTGFYTFGFAWGINNGLLSKEEYLPALRKAWKGLVNCQQPNGMIGFVQPIGAAPSLQVSAQSWEVYGTGAFLCAGSEILKLDL